MSEFGTRLKTARTNSGFTQRQVAERLSITERAYRSWEGGDREPSIEKLILITRTLNVSADYLLGLTDEME